ncbi:TonB-dependent receptor [Aliifodinibius sp. S!AR15-10]|uniref:SusC/RagA family TonB-linked outer membrane protein n=1 Tax=Aliifodinibius sp. S!AR15-10 TaxID=2950437 RepID=UPI0028626447|nr:TonB-dependent receptor [Aliifodinibius sp. S!AR15-10]MDR8390912.1 TonB-dependent receptor [Aliifodinibius sp. S!AR15-10]
MKGIMIRTIGILMLVILVTPLMYAQDAQEDNRRRALALSNEDVVQSEVVSDQLKQLIELDLRSAPLEKALQRVAQKAGLKLMYNKQSLPGKYVTIQKKAVTLYDALWEILDDTGLRFALSQNQQLVLMKMKKPSKEVTMETVTGQVTDAQTGDPMPGVNISVLGTTTGTSSGSDGSYSLNVPSLSDTLMFSFIGYQTEQVPINGRTTIDLAMAPQAIQGSDIVVVGYGTQSTRDISGSVQNITSEGLEDLPVAQLGQKLQGKLSGVNINQNTGAPGEGIKVRVRGAASITAGSDPLYVVDGMPITGDISNFNPNEIESISVLKDASATSLYGSRAANGVVLIETKKAVAGQTQVNFNASYGVQQIPQRGRPNVMEADEYAQFQKEIDEFNGRPVDEAFQDPSQYGNGTDWYDAVTEAAPIQDYSLSLSTGTETFSTTAVAGYLNQDGVVIGTGYERYSLRVNTDFQPIDNLNIRFNVAPNVAMNTNSNTDDAPWNGGILSGAVLSTPLAPARNDDGSLPLIAQDPATFGNPNFLRTARERVNDEKETQLLSNAIIEYEILDGLSLKTSGNVDLGSRRFFNFNPSTTGQLFAPPPIIPNGFLLESTYTSWVNENTLTFQRDLGDHSIDALVGATAQKFELNTSEITATNYPDDKVREVSAAGQTTIASDVQEWSLLSYLARVNYSYKDRYLFSASIRRDGSSRFGSNNRWGNFPSVSAGWIISEEPFMPESDLISFLKLRASYGVVGNFSIGNYTHISTISSANYAFGSGLASGRAVDNLGDQGLGWETNKEYNLGLDVNFFDERLQLTYNYYRKNTSDLLYNVEVPLASGFGNIQTNIGELKFWGHEFSVKSFNIENTNLSWSTDFNISFDRNEVVELGTQNAALFSGIAESHITEVGEPIGQFYGLIHDGVYDDQEEFDNSPKHTTSQVGTVKFRDVNGDGIITQDDRTVIGNPHPDFTFGMTNTVRYKNFDFSLTLSGAYGNDIIRLEEQYLTNLDGVFNVLEGLKDRWKSPEDPGDGRYGSVAQGTTFLERDWWNSRFIYDGSNITARNITLGYTLPVSSNSMISRLRFYGSVQNAFIITSYPGPNPEVNTNADTEGGGGDTALGIDQTAYPIPRTVSFGVNLSF